MGSLNPVTLYTLISFNILALVLALEVAQGLVAPLSLRLLVVPTIGEHLGSSETNSSAK